LESKRDLHTKKNAILKIICGALFFRDRPIVGVFLGFQNKSVVFDAIFDFWHIVADNKVKNKFWLISIFTVGRNLIFLVKNFLLQK
jgi:hypothetical protein